MAEQEGTMEDLVRFVLEASEGRYGGYDPSLAEAGITELGRRYVYVARKRHG